MKTIRGVATAGIVVMTAVVVWAFATGDLGVEGEVLFGLSWGVVSVVDIYVGVALMLVWIRWRDGTAVALTWFVILLVLGHLGSAAYVAWRAWTSPDVPTLLLGPRRTMSATANPLSGSR